MLDLSRLSPAQREAVLAGDGPLLIIAGPGSGKTTLLAARIAYLITVRRVAPSSVLAITFTTRATQELRNRLSELLGEPGRSVDVTTFHAFGLRIIRQWSEALGFEPGGLVVYGDHEARAALREVVDLQGLDLEHGALPELAAALDRYRLGSNAVSMFESLPLLAEAYEHLLRRRRAVDYPAMLVLPLRLFEARTDALRLYQDAYRYVLCDEFQDVCEVQYALLQRLTERHRNLVVVGDPLQTLYGWRGADVRFLLHFPRDFPEVRVVGLDINFRSTGRIVDLANALGARLAYRPPLRTDNSQGELVHLYVATDEHAEAAFVASEIARLSAERQVNHLGEVGILYRTNEQAVALANALRERHLPYRVRGSCDLFGRREVRDAVAYIRLAHNPDDVLALARIVNAPPRRLGRLAELLRARPVAVQELPSLAARHGSSVKASVEALVALIDDLHAQRTQLAPVQLIDLALDRSGYRTWLTSLSDGEARLAHLTTFRTLAERHPQACIPGALGGWLTDLHLDEDLDADAHDPERVLLTTIHGAKGGEWNVVFVVGMEEGLLPHHRALTSAASSGIEEELRVTYVAITRPRQRLYLTCCRTRRWGERSQSRRPSRFLRGLPVELVDRAA